MYFKKKTEGKEGRRKKTEDLFKSIKDQYVESF